MTCRDKRPGTCDALVQFRQLRAAQRVQHGAPVQVFYTRAELVEIAAARAVHGGRHGAAGGNSLDATTLLERCPR